MIAGIPEAAAGGDLRARTVRGLKWTYLAGLGSGALQIAVTATLSRLLIPSDYGLMAAAALFLRFGSYFAEMGIGQALVQKPVIGDQDVRAAFTASSAIGLAMAAAMFAAAPWARAILDTSALVPVVRLLSLSLALSGLASTSLSLLRRHLRFDVLSKIEVAGYAVSYGLLGIPLALAGGGVWALCGALLAQPALTLVLAYAAVRHPLRPALRWRSCRGLLGYGSQLSLTGFAEYLFFFAEPSAVGRSWGGAALGLYNRATMLANLPGSQMTSALMKVLFPAFSRAQDDRPRLASAYLQGLTAVNLVALPLAAAMIPAAPDLVLAVLGRQYRETAPLVQVMVFALPLGMAASVAATVTNARGEMRSRLLQQLGLCLLMGAAVWVASARGLLAVALASVIIQAIRLAAFQRLALRSLALPARALAGAFAPGVLAALLAAGVAGAVAWAMRAAPLPARLALEMGAALVSWAGFCLLRLPRQLALLAVEALDGSGAVGRLPALIRYRERLLAKLPAAIGAQPAC